MPHIDVGNDAPGILGLMRFRPETADPLNALAEALLRAPGSLSRGERELIAAYVSRGNDCTFCTNSHAELAAQQLDGGMPAVRRVLDDRDSSAFSEKLTALLAIADLVRRGGREVTDEAVATARKAGATDVELHDTVLIAAAFCMYNRYVDGLATSLPTDPAGYRETAARLIARGYGS
ncbi:carboxymuconolactone decarboxylase family protein [Streptomyces griseocarneus]|uniref:carboxymuconolactone decarboxylase family protein n=1 Tax=Streptomyces griseocarneus TaxID=51201 RepID=UPI00167D81E2|nr:carboxymuconolactone decarboxylase family protein [Streptomyces griseocarneus]MBZ6473856.1 carboxymuconolactone decarboxylase family protein [Streptomyces griseocarneus]GHG65550.1 carboxymuconolactone decarboxylase [Streptomyces griseocarneus]